MNVLITGGASGLGLALTKTIAAAGHKVAFTYHSSQQQAGVLETEFAGCKGYACDFKDAQSVQNLIDQLSDIQPDALINNALASLQAVQFQKWNVSDLGTSFAENVVPTLAVTQGCIEQFRKKKSGRIITILSSYLVNKPPTGYAEYVANKSYLLSMSKSWASENAKFNIVSNCVSPSTMKTGLTADVDERLMETMALENPLRRLVEPQEVAEFVCSLLTASQQINATHIVMNGGQNVI